MFSYETVDSVAPGFHFRGDASYLDASSQLKGTDASTGVSAFYNLSNVQN